MKQTHVAYIFIKLEYNMNITSSKARALHTVFDALSVRFGVDSKGYTVIISWHNKKKKYHCYNSWKQKWGSLIPSINIHILNKVIWQIEKIKHAEKNFMKKILTGKCQVTCHTFKSVLIVPKECHNNGAKSS